MLPCPARLPHDLEVGQKLARWFGEGYNSVGTSARSPSKVNRRRTKQENVSDGVEFEEPLADGQRLHVSGGQLHVELPPNGLRVFLRA